MMELPRPRPFGTEGRKATHDFLSLCSHSSLHQDPRPPSQENFPKTRDFFGKTSAKDETTGAMASSVERPPPPAAPPPPPAHSVEHILPGGIGTYSISHISYFDQKLPKPEASLFTVAQASSTDRTDENSNCSSYTNGGFTLWDESAAKKGKTGKENVQTTSAREAEVKLGPWASTERPSQSSSNNNHRNSFNCSLSSSQPPGPKNKSFMEMIRSAKSGSHQEEEFDDDDGEFVLKKETSPVPKGELRVNVDGKSNSDQKANTPRSKHSATEQRRRSKINDRFQTLRSLIPNSDQKRDKASFLLEVIEYIQYLQEKVNKYEGSFQQWSPEPAKMVPLRNGQRLADGFVDQSRGINIGTSPAMVFATKVDENHVVAPPSNYRSSQNPMEPEISSATAFKAMEHHPGMTNRAVLFPMSLQPNISTCPRTSGLVAIADSDLEKKAPQPLSQISQIASWSNERASLNGKLKEQELTIEGGTISISNVYSQGLLNTLTQALQSSGVDLSQASISVQIELGKQSNGRVAAPVPKDIEARNQGITRPRVASEDSNQALKKLKTSKS